MTRLSVPDSVGSRALAWLDREYARFDVFQEASGDYPDEARQTAVCELALGLLVLSREQRLLRDDRFGRLTDYLVHIYRNPYFHTYVFDGHPLAFTGHLITWLAVEALKCPGPIPRERMQELAVTNRIASAQRPAFRTMELRYFLDWGGFRHSLPDYSTLFERTCLAGLDPPPSSFTFHHVYEATHVVFYLTDFGRRVLTFPDTAGICRIVDLLLAFLGMLTELHHWDLVAEVLLSLRCLKVEVIEDQERAWQALSDAQDSNGAILEGPSGDRVQPAGAELVPAEFLALYHRSLVSALAAFVGRDEEMS